MGWGQDWIVTFNDRKTKLISVSRSKDKNFSAAHMGPQVLAYSEDIRILGMDISSDLSWGKYISGIAKSIPLCVLVTCLVLGNSSLQVLSCIYMYLYKTSIRPLIEYCLVYKFGFCEKCISRESQECFCFHQFIIIVCNEPRAWAVFGLASAAVNRNQYRFYLLFPTFEFHNFCFFMFNNDVIFLNLFAL